MRPIKSRMRRARLLVAGLALALAGGAFAAAISQGTVLYIKAKNTRLMASSSPTAKAVRVMQPGEQVSYVGPDRKDRRWHQVRYGDQLGVVFQSNLSVTPPKVESRADTGQAGDVTSYASRGAATKALGDGAIAYSQTLKDEEVARRLLALEALAKRTEPEVARRAREAGLFPVLGEPATASRKEASR